MTGRHPAPGGDSAAPGTPESRWQPWLAAQRWPEFAVDPTWRGALICAAHPDDDVLGVGGLMTALAEAGIGLRLLAATDGEGSHPGSRRVSPPQLARARIAETADALDALGIRPVAATRLGLPDSGLQGHVAVLESAVTTCAAEVDVIVAPWAHDAHPDHEVLGRAALAAGAALGVPVLAFPVWTWQWAEPGDPRVPWNRAVRVSVADQQRAAKRVAIDCFGTQVRPLGPDPEDSAVLEPEMLAHFDRELEVLFR